MRPTTFASIAILAASTAVMVQVASAPTEDKLSDPVATAPVAPTDNGAADEAGAANVDAIGERERQAPE